MLLVLSLTVFVHHRMADQTPTKTPNREHKRGNRSSGKSRQSHGDAQHTPQSGSQHAKRTGRTGRASSRKKRDGPEHEEHLSPEEVSSGLASGKLLLGSLRIASGNRHKSFISVPGLIRDVFIDGINLRNRALNGDIVVIALNAQDEWQKPTASAQGTDAAGPAAAAAPPLERAPSDSSAASGPHEDTSGALWMPLVDVDMYSTLGAAASDGSVDIEEAMTRLGLSRTDCVAQQEPPLPVLKAIAQAPRSLSSVAVPQHTPWRKLLLQTGTVSYVDGLQPTGKVVAIAKEVHSRECIGTLHAQYGQTVEAGKALPSHHKMVTFMPLDSRVPWIQIPIFKAPADFKADPSAFANTLFAARITKWAADARNPLGRIDGDPLGQSGDVQVETDALLRATGISDEEFSAAVDSVLDAFRPRVHGDEFDIPEEEFHLRRDLRETRIFTIDPWSARDLDDALHITPQADGTIEIGVHIADVSYFVEPGTALDKEASERATSVYLVQKVIPMLPRLLCESLCSLNPSVDRLAFSCIWRMKADGTLLGSKPWVGRTIIRSCAKLDYGTATRFIEGEVTPQQADAGRGKGETDGGSVLDGIPDAVWPIERRPTGGVSTGDVIRDVLLMHQIAFGRRKQRFDSGAVSLHRTKLSVQRDAQGEPVGLGAYPIGHSNRLVEEYMLLANYLVAQHLIMHAASQAPLRRHPPPLSTKVGPLVDTLHRLGFTGFQWSSSKSLQKSLTRAVKQAKTIADKSNTAISQHVQEYMASGSGEDLLLPPQVTPEMLILAVESLVMQPMQPASYFAAGNLDGTKWGHYALAIPYYTHFTSPIRRYADVMVHRLLQATLDGPDAVHACASADDVMAQSDICNERKQAAKQASQMSDQVYMCLYLKRHPTEVLGMVTEVRGERWFDVIVPDWGLEGKIEVARQGGEGEYDDETHTLRIRPSKPEGAPAGWAAPAPAVFTVREMQPIRLLLVARLNCMPIDYDMIPSDLVQWDGPAVQAATAQITATLAEDSAAAASSSSLLHSAAALREAAEASHE